MDFSKYSILNMSLLNVAKSMNVLMVAEEPDPPKAYFRPKEAPFVITYETERSAAAVTAHDLLQYKNKVYSITLHENMTSWLCELLGDCGRGHGGWN